MLLALCSFGAAGILVAVGFELRLPFAKLRASSSILFALNAIVLAAAGFLALDADGHTAFGQAWIAGLAVVYVALGLAGSRSKRISHDLQLLVLTLGVLLADVAFAAIVSGPLLALGWAGSSVVFAAIARGRRQVPSDALLAQLGLGGHLALAIGHALVHDASPATTGGPVDVSGLIVTAAIAAACFTSARIASDRSDVRAALDALGLAFVAYLTALAADGPALAIAWAVEAVTVASIARSRRDPVALFGMAGFLTLSAAHLLAVEATLDAVASSTPVGALDALALGAFGAAAFVCARFTSALSSEGGIALDAVAAATAAYLAAATLDGPALALTWTLEAVVAAGVARWRRDAVAFCCMGGFLTLAAAHVLSVEAPFDEVAIAMPVGLLDALALAGFGVAAFVCARLTGFLSREGRMALDGVAAVTGVYLAAATLDGAAFAGACGAAALLLAVVAGRTKSRELVLVSGGYATVALGHALAYEAPFEAFLYGTADLSAADCGPRRCSGGSARARAAGVDRPSDANGRRRPPARSRCSISRASRS